jgi:hypothetical protein
MAARGAVRASCVNSGELLSPTPPGEKTAARENQTGQSSTRDRTGDRANKAEIISGLEHLASGGKMSSSDQKLVCSASADLRYANWVLGVVVSAHH